jgi:hypothetical protein
MVRYGITVALPVLDAVPRAEEDLDETKGQMRMEGRVGDKVVAYGRPTAAANSSANFLSKTRLAKVSVMVCLEVSYQGGFGTKARLGMSLREVRGGEPARRWHPRCAPLDSRPGCVHCEGVYPGIGVWSNGKGHCAFYIDTAGYSGARWAEKRKHEVANAEKRVVWDRTSAH